MVKLGCSFSGKPGKDPGDQDGATTDSVPLISPLDVSQLQPPFPDQVSAWASKEGSSQPARNRGEGQGSLPCGLPHQAGEQAGEGLGWATTLVGQAVCDLISCPVTRSHPFLICELCKLTAG